MIISIQKPYAVVSTRSHTQAHTHTYISDAFSMISSIRRRGTVSYFYRLLLSFMLALFVLQRQQRNSDWISVGRSVFFLLKSWSLYFFVRTEIDSEIKSEWKFFIINFDWMSCYLKLHYYFLWFYHFSFDFVITTFFSREKKESSKQTNSKNGKWNFDKTPQCTSLNRWNRPINWGNFFDRDNTNFLSLEKKIIYHILPANKSKQQTFQWQNESTLWNGVSKISKHDRKMASRKSKLFFLRKLFFFSSLLEE